MLTYREIIAITGVPRETIERWLRNQKNVKQPCFIAKQGSPLLHNSGSLLHNFLVAECADFEEFGYGSNSTVAIKDLQATIAELYFTLRDEQDSLGGRLPELWVKIKAKIQER